MADKRRDAAGGMTLVIFLLGLFSVVITVLYFDLRVKYAQLKDRNAELAASQVLLMVPDSQAEALAQWLETHPRETERLLKQVETKANEGDGVATDDSVKETESIPKALVPEVISENSDGVKVIALPNGGIRVTTRDEKIEKKQ
ncbi:membrane anchored protein in chemotaxis locus [Shewanella litorisediminis]|uniref:Membrane anchored protein in chemotaxis locus n=1 Tax=Shewanella litorisediminis TaxID=1173586 RepID=A0ABX7FZU9_9GAMM|nr:membrane anchored protein in chemotaxis locus [Shewanella litorisediminis]MCL2919658.1 membrane anchored protein in chemotaxis locus [Shewanella litorisediminis]QRH00546.1 membrane anchored protein in chemotaxis locus [Shewanella litorisediminis]